MDRWRESLFGRERMETFKGQLNDCKSMLNVALLTATMYVSSPGIRDMALLLQHLADMHSQHQNDPPRVYDELII